MVSVYLDHNATTALDERVLAVMQPYLQGTFGNPSSVHRYGRQVRAGLDQAREQLAGLFGVNASQLVFTSGGTEANNLALYGVVTAASTPGHIIIGATEHPSVMQTALFLERLGWQVDKLSVDDAGQIQLDQLPGLLQDNTRLVSVMMANNETGVITDIAAIRAMMQDHPAILHCDAVQALGKVRLDFPSTGVDLMSLSAHKIYGPTGAGVLIKAGNLDLQPLYKGGSQEFGLRAGTENVAAIVGFGHAAELVISDGLEEQARLLRLRLRLEQNLCAEIPGVVIFARQAQRLPNTVFFSVPDIAGEMLVMALDEAGFAVASGSACSSRQNTPSHVLLAMGVDAELAQAAIRVSLGRENDIETVDRFVDSLKQQVQELSKQSVLAW